MEAGVGAAVSHLPGHVQRVAVVDRRQGTERVEPFGLQAGRESGQPVPFRTVAADRLIEIPDPHRPGCCGQDMLDGITEQPGALAVPFPGPDLGVIGSCRPGRDEQDPARRKRLHEMDPQGRTHVEPGRRHPARLMPRDQDALPASSRPHCHRHRIGAHTDSRGHPGGRPVIGRFQVSVPAQRQHRQSEHLSPTLPVPRISFVCRLPVPCRAHPRLVHTAILPHGVKEPARTATA